LWRVWKRKGTEKLHLTAAGAFHNLMLLDRLLAERCYVENVALVPGCSYSLLEGPSQSESSV
jgi:hypothetical protein